MRQGTVIVRLPSRTSATGWRDVKMTVEEAAARNTVQELAQAVATLSTKVAALTARAEAAEAKVRQR